MNTLIAMTSSEAKAYREAWRHGERLGRFIGLAMLKQVENDRLVAENRKLHYEATHDLLTDLPNRRGLEGFLANTKIEGHIVLYADGTRVHTINNELGHEVGDRAIVGIADVLRSVLREDDIVARIGGDEFMAVLKPVQRDGQTIEPSEHLFSITGEISNRTQILLNNNADLVKHGFDIAVGSAIGHQGMGIDTLQKTAEANMMLEKATQHDRFDSQR